jgi:hypothetical protein
VGSIAFATNPTENTMKILGQLLRQAREANCMGLEQVARKLGYKNVVKGVRKLKVVEATGTVNDEILVRLADTLGIDWALLEDVIECLHHTAQDGGSVKSHSSPVPSPEPAEIARV